MIMDTDVFSDMAYSIIVQAARDSDTLKAELGALSRNYKNEDDWLHGVQKHFQAILSDPNAYVDFWNLEEEEGVTATRIMDLASQLNDQVDIVLGTSLKNRGKREDHAIDQSDA
jgi:hypothetical protein